VLDSTDPDQVRAAAQKAPLDRTIVIVASKSGSTSEIAANLAYFWAQAQEQIHVDAGRHFIAITDPGTSLEKLAKEQNFRKVFYGEPTVGGRFSALSAFGLVPAALIGLDLAKLLASASWMSRQTAAEVPAGRNPGVVLGAILGQAARGGRDKLTLITDPEWEPFGAWLEQLIAESSGKQGNGIVPVDGEPILAPETYGKDRLFVYLRGNGRLEDTSKNFLNAGHPVLTIAANDPYQIGAEFYRWEVATAIACDVLGVNPFDQPDVQDNKTLTKEKMMDFERDHRFDEGEPIWEGPEGTVFGWRFDHLNHAKGLREVVQAFLKQARPEDTSPSTRIYRVTPRRRCAWSDCDWRFENWGPTR
jgi:transaldolase/glucose-6-phosphate isomerase